MEKKQYELYMEVIRRFDKAGVLKGTVLIGSWCLLFYKDYFENVSSIRTRDVDFLVPLPLQIKGKVDVAEMLKDLGFITSFKGVEGYIKLEHPELIIEFLVPEKGRGSDKPYKLPELGINAQRLRFMEMLAENTIQVKLNGIEVIIPHPVTFALHKLLICTRRSGPNKKDKSEKDKRVALQILNALVIKKEVAPIKGIFRALHKNRKKEIIQLLKNEDEIKLLDVLLEI